MGGGPVFCDLALNAGIIAKFPGFLLTVNSEQIFHKCDM